MGNSIIKSKSFYFAIKIIDLYKFLVESKREYVVSKQLLRYGTAIGASIREAEYAESKADFIHKLSISLKEANESEYWIDLLLRTGYITQESYDTIISDLSEILKLLTSIIKTSKQNR